MLNFGKSPRKIATRPLERELGFGNTANTLGRMMNPDGSFNVERQRIGALDNAYSHLLTIPWWQFFLAVFAGFLLMNSFFAGVYCTIGINHLNGTIPGTFFDNFRQAYFFSSQTLTTVGYGHVSPLGLTTNIVASLESFLGLLTFAMISSLLYGRFSRPMARIAFSENMLVSPYRGGQGLMFRMVNARRSELIEMEVQIILAINQREDGAMARRFFPLALEISKVSFFSLSWTIVHALNADSPLYGFSPEELRDSNAELLVLVKGMEETNQQTVYTKRSYTMDEIVWNARFRPVISYNKRGMPKVMTRKIGAYDPVEPVTTP